MSALDLALDQLRSNPEEIAAWAKAISFLDCSEDRSASPPRRRRRPSFARMLRHARKVGSDLTVAPDGSMTFRCGSQPTNGDNPWDEVLP